MPYYCFKCQNEVQISSATQVGRREQCPACRVDLHVCKNCRHYDPAAYNECREVQAERVLDKENANFCDYFVYRQGRGVLKAGGDKQQVKAKLEALFKK